MGTATPQTGYAPVNGLDLYYEIHGAGLPLVLLHGGLGSTDMFGDRLPRLAESRQAIAVDLQAHGRTAEMMKPSPIYATYARVAPRPEDWPVLVSKAGALLRRDFDWSSEVAAITAPTLLVFGDADAVRIEHVAEFFGLLGGGKRDAGWDGSGMSDARLAILPGVTHYNILSSPALASTVTAFLDAPLPRAG